jgi:hypothetical protein
MPGEQEKKEAIEAFNFVVFQCTGKSNSNFNLKNFNRNYCVLACAEVMAHSCASYEGIDEITETINRIFTQENEILHNIEGLKKITRTLRDANSNLIALYASIKKLEEARDIVFPYSAKFNDQTFYQKGLPYLTEYLIQIAMGLISIFNRKNIFEERNQELIPDTLNLDFQLQIILNKITRILQYIIIKPFTTALKYKFNYIFNGALEPLQLEVASVKEALSQFNLNDYQRIVLVQPDHFTWKNIGDLDSPDGDIEFSAFDLVRKILNDRYPDDPRINKIEMMSATLLNNDPTMLKEHDFIIDFYQEIEEHLKFNEQTFLEQGNLYLIQYLMNIIQMLPQEFNQDTPSIQERIEQLKETNIKQTKEILHELSIDLKDACCRVSFLKACKKPTDQSTNPFECKIYPRLDALFSFFKYFDNKFEYFDYKQAVNRAVTMNPRKI